MKKFIFLFVIFHLIFFQSFGQKTDKVNVRVPEKFEFLNEKNQYQLNALAAFLFEKKGFEAIYEEPQPPGLNPCEVFRADVHDDSNFLTTKVYISLTNCNNEEVFKSELGVSREKDYKTAYHDALRKAAESLDGIASELKQPENSQVVGLRISSKGVERSSERASEKGNLPKEVIIDPIVSSEEIREVDTLRIKSQERKQSGKSEGFRSYSNGAVTYILKDTPAGYELFRKDEKEKFATLLKSGGGENFLFSAKSFSGNAFFDKEGNLVVEYLDSQSGQLVSAKYVLLDQ